MKKQNSQFGKAIDKQTLKTIKGGWGYSRTFFCATNCAIYSYQCPVSPACPSGCFSTGNGAPCGA